MSPRQRWAARGLALLVVLGLVAPVAASALTYEPDPRSDLRAGTITSPANGTTVVSVQGYVFGGNTNDKKPARIIGVGERGRTRWVHNDSVGGGAWFFDVDPLPNGNLLVSSPRAGQTVVYAFDPDTQERVWQERFDMEDTHDVDRLSEDELLIANMREWNATSERSDDRIVVYNRTTEEITWEWYFRDHFPPETDGGYNDDWSHVNDVDYIGDGRLLLSPRNFDQAVVVDMSSKEIVMRLGSDDEYEVLREQHNPDYLVSDDGTPTMLVADSGNNRVVEYAREDSETSETSQADGEAVDGEWVRTWSVGSDTLNWPRDADRLPNGNTLITDTLNHRVIEVTPQGEIVWEYYATWGPYDAERVAYGDESSGPTIRDMNASGTYDITGSAGLAPGGDRGVSFPVRMRATFAETPIEGPMTAFATRWAHLAPWLRPVWMSSWDFAYALGAGFVLVGWGLAEAVAARRRLTAVFREMADRVAG